MSQNSDVNYLLAMRSDSLETLQNFCKTNIQVSKMCLRYKSNISRHLLEI